MKTTTILKDTTYKLATTVVTRAYALLDSFPEEEKWGMQALVRSSTFQLSSNLAEAHGAIDPRDKKWAFGRARAQAFTASNAFKVAGKTGVLELDPQFMVDLQTIIDSIDVSIADATAAIPAWFKEMDPPKENK